MKSEWQVNDMSQWTTSEMKENDLTYREMLESSTAMWSAELKKIEKELDSNRTAPSNAIKKLLRSIMEERKITLVSYIEEAQIRLPEIYDRTVDLIRLAGDGRVIQTHNKA